MNTSINFWNELKNYINELPDNHIMNKQDVKNLFKGVIPEKRPKNGYTFEKYITYLINYKILERVDKCKYKIKKRVPEGMSSEDLKSTVYRKRQFKHYGLLEA